MYFQTPGETFFQSQNVLALWKKDHKAHLTVAESQTHRIIGEGFLEIIQSNPPVKAGSL